MASSGDVVVHIDPDDMFDQANDTRVVRAAIRARATSIAARGTRQGGSLSVEEADLPNGRHVARVINPDGASEHGNSQTPRRRTLRKGIGSR